MQKANSTVVLDSKSILRRNTDLIFNKIDEDIVILSITNEEYYHLNKVGSKIWELLSHPKTLAEIIDVLTQTFDVSFEDCSHDTMIYLRDLLNSNIVSVKNE